MREKKIAELKRLFAVLDKFVLANENDLIQLIILCLDILQISTEDRRSVKLIAQELGVIIRQRTSFSEKLKNDFSIPKENLSAELRGFSQLLDFVTKDQDIKVDYLSLLGILPEKYQAITGIFIELITQIEKINDLNLALEFSLQSAMSICFINNLQKLLAAKLFLNTNQYCGLLNDWLKQNHGAKKSYLSVAASLDFNNSQKILEFIADSNENNEALLVVYLTHLSEDNIDLEIENQKKLDGLLIAYFHLDIQALIDAGFFMFGEQRPVANVAKIFSVV